MNKINDYYATPEEVNSKFFQFTSSATNKFLQYLRWSKEFPEIIPELIINGSFTILPDKLPSFLC